MTETLPTVEPEYDVATPLDTDFYLALADVSDAEDRYVVHLLQALPHRLEGLKIVLDCAHGAAYKVAPAALWELGAEVIAIGVTSLLLPW